MAVKRDEQGRLVLVSMVDGEEVVTKVIPKHEEQLYLRRGVTGADANIDFPAKAECVKVQEMERPYDVHRSWAGGDVQTFDEVVKDLPDHPECREHEYLREPIVKEGSAAVQIRIDSKFRETVHYNPMPGVSKEVVYFLTHTTQKNIKAREGEIAQVEWVPLEQVEASLTHENDKVVFRSAMKTLQAEECQAKG